jgi:hypothetical protein
VSRTSSADEHVAWGELGGEPAAERRRERNAAVAGGFVQPEREPAAPRADQVDLHDHRHRPGKPLIHAEQQIGGDDPGPARRKRDQERHRQRQRPAQDQQPAAAEALGAHAGTQVRERLGEPEGDDEREHRGARTETEVGLADQRQRRALEADHRPDEGVDSDEQRELREVLAQAEPDLRH